MCSDRGSDIIYRNPGFFQKRLDTVRSYGIIENMAEDIPKNDLKLFSLIIQNLGTVIKNSILYPVSHPISELSIKNFKSSLDKWLIEKEVLDIGIAPESILLDGNFVDQKSELYQEVGSHLHSHGVSAISFRKGLVMKELVDMFKFLKKDAKLMREGGALESTIPSLDHITIKAVDYSLLLEEGEGGGLSEGDEELWRNLTSVSEESRRGKLPEEREEFIRNFLQDSKNSATVLNKIYKDAVSRLEGDETVTRTRESIARIYDYMARNPEGVPETARTDIGKIVSRLDPEFVLRLFSPDSVDGQDFDLAGEIMKEVPDEFVAGFVESLIKSSGGLNENLLKVFERLSPGGAREGKIVSMVAGRLSDTQAFTHEALAEIQMSIKEVFATNPESGFMSQMYNLTVDTFIDRKATMMNLPKDLVSMVESYDRAATEEGFKGQEAELILNLMWHETDQVDLSRLCARITGILPELFRIRDIPRLKDIFSFFFEEMEAKNRSLPGIKDEINNVITVLREDSVIKQIVLLLAGSDEKGADDTVFMLEKIRGPEMLRILLDSFCSEQKDGRRNNLALMFKKLHSEEVDTVVERIKISDSRAARELLGVVKQAFPERARLFVTEIMSIDDPAVRREILEDFIPETEDARSALKVMLKKEKDPGLKRQAIIAMLGTKDGVVVGDLFSSAGRVSGENKLLTEIIETSGEINSAAAVPYLVKLLKRRDVFRREEKIKLASVVALGRIRNEEALDAIRKAASGGTEAVKTICDVILRLEDEKIKNKPKAGSSSDGDQG